MLGKVIEEANRKELNLYLEVIRFIFDKDNVKIADIQREFKIGYSHAGRIIDWLNAHGLVKRGVEKPFYDVLFKKEDFRDYLPIDELKTWKKSNIFVCPEAYIDTENNKVMYKSISAMAEDGDKFFYYELDQSKYADAELEMLNKFAHFCKEDCKFTNSAFCDIWFTNRFSSSTFDKLRNFLRMVTWGCVNYMDSLFDSEKVHTNYKDFDDFMATHNYPKNPTPRAVKDLFLHYENEIMKNKFDIEELGKMEKYFYENYERIYDKKLNLKIKFALEYILARIYGNDVILFAKLLNYACEKHIKKKDDKADKRFYDFCESTLYDYNELFHYEDFILNYNDEIPMKERKNSIMFFACDHRDWLFEFFLEVENQKH